MTLFKPALVEEDFEAWDLYQHTEHRWAFNKLEVAMRQGIPSGPAATAPKKSGEYLFRPTYNVYGMGVGAKRFTYNAETDYEKIINYGIVPPGNFWSKWLEGPHLSIDYNQSIDGAWHVRSVWEGAHNSSDNLTRFQSWTRLDESYAPAWNHLPCKASFLYDPDVPTFNVETIGGKIIEIHLRLGNDPFDEYPVGTEITPVWNEEDAPDGEWKGNLHTDMELYSARGYLSDVRRGYVVKRPQ